VLLFVVQLFAAIIDSQYYTAFNSELHRVTLSIFHLSPSSGQVVNIR